MAKSRTLVVSLLLVILCSKVEAFHEPQRFVDWFWYDNALTDSLRGSCSTEYNAYLAASHDSEKKRKPVVVCLLDAMDDLGKSEMASAGVLLGLMPTILSFAGSTLTQTALLSLRRPLLACLLAMGSPGIPPLRSFEREDIPRLLRRRKDSMALERATSFQGPVERGLVVSVELVLVLAAIGNVFYTSYELGVKTFVSWSQDISYHPLLWISLIGGIHIWGSMALRQDVREVSPAKGGISQRIKRWMKDEFSPCASHGNPTILRHRPDTFLFLFMSWWASFFTLAHYMYGTVIFSSLLFISVPEATKILLRFLASTLCCRIIVMYELSGMRQVSRTSRGEYQLDVVD